MNLTRRPRRLRATPQIRALVREGSLSADDFVFPLFISEKVKGRQPVASMPGVAQLDEDALLAEARGAFEAGVRAVILFGIPAVRDEKATQAYAENGVVQRAVRRLKRELPKLIVMTDVCLCEYMSHGHCGVTEFHGDVAHVHNDASVELIVATALSHAKAGADVVAPSDMMDGRIGAIRTALDAAGFENTILMSYAAKFASAFYGPFRDAAESAPQSGDRRSYQMDAANAREALREVELDVAEGADIVMVKPGLQYLDLVWRIKDRFGLPIAVYNVSGEYAMLKAAVANGWLDEKACVLEQMTAFKRAGADIIITYWARQCAEWLRSQ
ncbi:MAG: porphobilinogen synthase [Verrucomicrobiota bacterium]